MSYMEYWGILEYRKESKMRSETFETVHLGQVVQQSLDVSWHGRSLGNVGPGGVEARLVRVVLNADLLALGSHEAVAASDGVRGSNLLSGGSVIVGEVKVVVSILAGRVAENPESHSCSSGLFASPLLLLRGLHVVVVVVTLIVLLVVLRLHLSRLVPVSPSSMAAGVMYVVAAISLYSLVTLILLSFKQTVQTSILQSLLFSVLRCEEDGLLHKIVLQLLGLSRVTSVILQLSRTVQLCWLV